ncbi:ABC transporter permease [Oerskovia merdavium]|uniref:ABC transporter permease n=2 Tax=Oerskovia TaxID=162491 RepID=A0ABR8U306_9CELL|nr:ABC transporter permease [Oerskovia merdavium]MBD7982421.1 ABC transporter permease [Oerskovia merdavium]
MSSTATTPARVAPVPPAEDTVAFADPPTLGRRQALTADEDPTPSLAARLRGVGTRVLRASAAIVLFLVIWEIAPRVGLVDRVFLPPLSAVLESFGELLVSGELGKHVGTSLTRAGTGFAIAVLLAIPLGIAIGWWAGVAQFLGPFLELFRNTAALALLPVFILILGIGETSKITLVVYACFFPILLNTIAGVRTVDPLLVKSARSLGLPPVRLFQKVVLPAAVPTIFTGIRMAGTSSILVLIAAEMVGAKAGLGYLITYAQFNFQITNMYAGIIAISLVGVSINAVLVGLERHFSRWRTT